MREKTMVRMLNSTVSTYSWVGIYMVNGQNLQLDGWSGPVATEHLLIPVGKGICGFAAKAGRTEIVSDVRKDPRYLQCFPVDEGRDSRPRPSGRQGRG